MNSARQKYHILRRPYCALKRAISLKRQVMWFFLILLFAAPVLYTRAGGGTRVYAAASNNLNFQARLLSGTGAIVADGNYSIQFNLYNVATGGTTQWTETQASVAVRSGYLSVYLGSVTAFPGTIDWSEQQWLTMNVNGDGEMTPRLKLSAIPFAFRASQANTLTNGTGAIAASGLAQLGPSTSQVINLAIAALRLNQTGAGGLLQFQNNGSDVFTLANNGNIVNTGTYNTNTFSSTALTFGGASGTISTTANGNLTLSPNGSGVLGLNTGSGGTLTTNAGTIQRSGAAGLTIDLNNATTTNLTIVNSDASNVAGLSIEGGITAGISSAFSVNADGDITAVFKQLDGTTTTNGTSGLTPPSTSLTLTNAALFDVGNYVQVNDSNCGGAGVNICYAKITAKSGNNLTISPGLTWTTAKTVNEYHVPELGGQGTSQALANRYGRGYFISGVAAGNGTTFYNENSIESSLGSFNLLNGITGTLNIGVGSNAITLGGSSTTTSFAGTVNFTGTVSGVGPSSGTSGYLQRSGTMLTPATAGDSLSTSGNISTTGSGTITAAGGLSVSSGGASVSGGLTLVSGALNLSGGGITGAGSLAGITTISASGAITAATSSNTINGLIINSGGLSGVSTITASGAITAATSGNTINGLIINSGGLSGITTLNASGLITGVGLTAGSGLIQNSGGLTSSGTISLNANAGTNITNIATGTTTGQVSIGGTSTPLVINSSAFKVTSAGALSGVTTLGLSGAISGASATNTINGLIINSGSLSGITGFIQSSGNFAISGTGTFGTGTGTVSLNGATTITGTNTLTVNGGLTSLNAGLTVVGAAINLNASSSFAVNIGTGTSTGAIAIGGGSNTFSLNSTALNISSAGVISGITGLTNANGNAGRTISACTAGQYIGNGVRVDNGLITAGTCRDDANTLSDVRVKKDVASVGSVLDKLENVRVVTFNFKVDELPALNLDHGLQYGVIAQELEEIFPELVRQREDGYKEVNFQGLSFYTLKAVTELAAKVDAISGGAGANEVKTDGMLRLSHDGVLQNITGFTVISGGATIAGGINNNGGGITNIGAVLGATTISGQGLVLNANTSDNLLTLTKDSKGVFTVFNNGALGLQTDATNAFGVKDAAGISIFAIDTQNGNVKLGAGNTAKTVLFILDSRSTVDDPAGTNGASYYNAAAARFRCYQDNRWQDCLPAGDLTTSIASDKVTWRQPADATEFPDTPRITTSLNRAHEFRLNMRMIEAGAVNAACRLQYAASDNGPWSDLVGSGSGELAINKTGTLKTDWLKIADGARNNPDTIVRVLCKGGDPATTPVIYGVSLQIR